MKLSKVIRATLAVLAIFACIQGFNVLLSASTLDGLITDSVLSGYRSVSTQLANTIERGLRFSKPIEGFAGMNAHLNNTIDAIDGIPQIAVLGSDGEVLYTAVPQADPADMKGALAEYQLFSDPAHPPQWVELGNYYYDVHPLRGFQDVTQGYLVLKLRQKVIEYARDDFLNINLVIVISLALAVFIGQTGWLAFILSSVANADPARLQRSIRWLLLIIIGGAQLLYSMPTLSFFEEKIDVSAEYKARVVGAPFARDLEFLVQKNVDFSKIRGIDDELARLTDENPELSGARLEHHGMTVASYGEARDKGGLISLPVYESWPDRYTPRREVGKLIMVQDRDFVNSKLNKLALDLGTTLVICLILLGELASLFALFVGSNAPRAKASSEQQCSIQDIKDRALLVRGMCFLFFFGYDMVLTFIPLAARDLGGELFGLSPTVLSSLPISAEMALAGVGILLVGMLSRWISWSRLFLAGILCASLGGFLAGMAPTIGLFILARSVAGLGFGLTMMSGQLGLLHQANRAEGLGNMFAGIFAGSLCGCAAGAMLSEHFGYPLVFIVAGVFILLTMTLMPFVSACEIAAADGAQKGKAPLFAFLVQPRLWGLLLLVSLPAAACLSGFLYFVVPVRMESIGVSQGDIGRLFMLYGLCFIYVGPLIGKMVDRAAGLVRYVVLAGVLSGLALVLAAFYPGFWGYAASVLCTGIAQCMVASSLLVYVLTLPVAEELGTDKTASVFRLAERGGQIIGPVVFATMAATASLDTNLLVTGTAFVAMALLFVAIAQVGRRNTT